MFFKDSRFFGNSANNNLKQQLYVYDFFLFLYPFLDYGVTQNYLEIKVFEIV